MTTEELHQAYSDGATIRQLARDEGRHFTSIYNELKNSGQPFPLPIGRRHKIKHNEDREWICELYQQGATIQALADDWHVSKRTITNILDQGGVKRRKTGASGGKVYALEDL